MFGQIGIVLQIVSTQQSKDLDEFSQSEINDCDASAEELFGA